MKPNPQPPPIDPTRELSADLRQGAKVLREFYVALVREGFSSAEAIRIIAACAAKGRQA